MISDPKFSCDVHASDVDVRSPHSFHRNISASFQLEGRGFTWVVEGMLVRTLDGFAVESVDRDELEVKPDQKADLLLEIHTESGLSENLDPMASSSIQFDVSDKGGGTLARQFDQLRDTVWT
jgi:hypothetical protein